MKEHLNEYFIIFKLKINVIAQIYHIFYVTHFKNKHETFK